MKTGLFGGTFNPIHLGHIQVITEVKNYFSMDKIYLIPSAVPPHKSTKNIIGFDDRLEMIRLATGDSKNLSENFIVSDIEQKRKGFSYTIDTIQHFLTEYDKNTELYLIMGLDAFLDIYTWKLYKEIFIQIPVIIMTRPGSLLNKASEIINDYLQKKISPGYRMVEDRLSFVHEKNKPVYLQNVSAIDISSTMIRENIKNDKDIKPYLHEKVYDYIKTKRLYL